MTKGAPNFPQHQINVWKTQVRDEQYTIASHCVFSFFSALLLAPIGATARDGNKAAHRLHKKRAPTCVGAPNFPQYQINVWRIEVRDVQL